MPYEEQTPVPIPKVNPITINNFIQTFIDQHPEIINQLYQSLPPCIVNTKANILLIAAEDLANGVMAYATDEQKFYAWNATLEQWTELTIPSGGGKIPFQYVHDKTGVYSRSTRYQNTYDMPILITIWVWNDDSTYDYSLDVYIAPSDVASTINYISHNVPHTGMGAGSVEFVVPPGWWWEYSWDPSQDDPDTITQLDSEQ